MFPSLNEILYAKLNFICALTNMINWYTSLFGPHFTLSWTLFLRLLGTIGESANKRNVTKRQARNNHTADLAGVMKKRFSMSIFLFDYMSIN